MKKLLYCALTLFAFSQNLEIQGAQKKTTKKTTNEEYRNGFYEANIAVIQECLKNDPNFLNKSRKEDGVSPLQLLIDGIGAVELKIRALEEVLKHKACTKEILDHQNLNGDSALSLLPQLPFKENILEIFLQKNADFKVLDSNSRNLLMKAIKAGNTPLIEYLSTHFPEMLTQKSKGGWSPLLFVIAEKEKVNDTSNSIFDLIMERTEKIFDNPQNWHFFVNGLEVENKKPKRIGDSTPLIRAIQAGNIHCVQKLLSLDYVDPNYPSKDKTLPLCHLAALKDPSSSEKIFNILMENRNLKLVPTPDNQSKKNGGLNLPFLNFALNDKLKEAAILAEKMEPDYFNNRILNGTTTLLHYFLKFITTKPEKKFKDYKELLNLIISKNPEAVNELSPNNVEKVTISPLILAACNGDVEMMMYLLEKGADVHYTDQPEAPSFLIYACQKTKSEKQFIQLLEYLEHKHHQELFFKEAENGFSLLIAAINNKKQDTIQFLVKKGAFERQTRIHPLLYLAKLEDDSVLTKNMLENLLHVLSAEAKNHLFNALARGDYMLIHHLVVIPTLTFQEKSECLKLLLAQPEFNINIQSGVKNYTALMKLLKNLVRKPQFDFKETLEILLNDTKSDLALTDVDGNTILHIAAETDNLEAFQKVLKACREKCSQVLKSQNGAEQTYTAYIKEGGAIQKGLGLLREEREARAKKNQELAQSYLTGIEKEITQEEQRQVQDTDKAEGTKEETAAESCNAPKKDEFSCSYTRTLKVWRRVAAILETEPTPVAQAALEELLNRDGYFNNPSKEIDPIRRTRATVYQNLEAMLRATHPGEDDDRIKELVVLKIAKEHGFPDVIIRTVINNHTDMPRNVTKETEVTCTVRATYQDSEGTHTGTYEVFGKIQPGNRTEIYHALFRETAVIPTPKPSKRISAATKDAYADAASASAAAADDDFTKVGAFTSEITGLPDKFIHRITDNKTGTVYTLEIPK